MALDMWSASRRQTPNQADYSGTLVLKEDNQVYAQVIRMLEDGRRCEAMCSDGTKRICLIPNPRSRTYVIGPGDTILVALRDGGLESVMLKYTPQELRLLKLYGELPETMKCNEEEESDVNLEA